MTQRYRKRSVIEAEQWFPGRDVPGVYTTADQQGWIDTLEGTMFVRPGSYIITGVRGERYACEQSIFEETYEVVE